MMTSTDDFIRRINAALQDSGGPLWLPSLTPDLVASEWRNLGRDLRITRESYGTARVLNRDPEDKRCLAATLNAPSRHGANDDSIQIEMLSEDVIQQWTSPGFRFFGAEEILRDGVKERVEEAIELLDGVPTMLATVFSLIRSLHLLDTSDDQVDVSFSEPKMPFSAFISVPGPGAQDGLFRVAEAMIHEAMHLQLTLIEGFVLLVEPTEETYFSPWRNERRTPQGVLHALYVFGVIDAFFGALLNDGPTSDTLWGHAIKRRAEITQQIESIRDFREESSLSESGTNLVSSLLI